MKTTLHKSLTLLPAVLALLGGFAAAQEPDSITTPNAMARLTKKVPPEFPMAAKQLNVTGTQEIQIVVSAAGDVEDAKVLKGNALFTSASLSAVRQWKFTPLTRDGQPVRFTSTVIINYAK
jgi:protein TonB